MKLIIGLGLLVVPILAQMPIFDQFYPNDAPNWPAYEEESYLPLTDDEYFNDIPYDQLALVDTSYAPHKETPDEYFARMPEWVNSPGWRSTVQNMYNNYMKKKKGKPLPEPSPATIARIDQQLNNAELQEHNRLRAQHGSPKLQYDEKIAAFAQDFADRMGAKMAQGYPFQHNQNTKPYKLGENMAGEGPEIDYTGNYARRWYSEIDRYRENGNRASVNPNRATGHFTQVVWKSTQKMGCGRSCYQRMGSNRKECLVICNYYPGGNMYKNGRPDKAVFDENVLM